MKTGRSVEVMRPIVLLIPLALFGCHAAAPPRHVEPDPPATVEEQPTPVGRHDVGREPTAAAHPSVEAPIQSAIDAADRARETVERRRYILDTRSDQKVSP